MEESILTSVKKVLGLAEDYTIFDQDILTHINLTFSVLNQLGVGPVDGYMIDSKTPLWAAYGVPMNQLNMVRTYVFLKVKMLFDPPATSFLIEMTNKQIQEFEWRLNSFREAALPHPIVRVV